MFNLSLADYMNFTAMLFGLTEKLSTFAVRIE